MSVQVSNSEFILTNEQWFKCNIFISYFYKEFLEMADNVSIHCKDVEIVIREMFDMGPGPLLEAGILNFLHVGIHSLGG